MRKNKEKALMLMLEGTMTMQEISECVKVSRKTLYNWINEDTDFKEEYDRRIEDMERMARARMGQLVPKALTRQEKIIDKSRNDMAAAMVAKDILDRTGFTAENKIQIDGGKPVIIIDDIPGERK